MHMGVSPRKTQACLTQLITLYMHSSEALHVEMYIQMKPGTWQEQKNFLFIFLFFFFFINFQLEQLGCNLWNLTTGSMCYTLFTPCAYQLYKSESKRILVLTFKRNSIHTCHMHGWILTDTPNSLCTFKCCWKQCNYHIVQQ